MPDLSTERISIEDLGRRIAVLEAERDAYRRHCAHGLGAAALAVVLVATAAVAVVAPEALVAQSFRLVDASGTERARLESSATGSVALRLYDATGIVTAELVLASSEPLLRVTGAGALGGEGERPTDSLAPSAAPRPEAPAPAARPAAPSRGPIVDWGEPPGSDAEDDDFDWAD